MTRRAYASLLQDELGHGEPAHRALSIMLTGNNRLSLTPAITATAVKTATSTAVTKTSSTMAGLNGKPATVGAAVTAMSVIGGVVAKQVLSSVVQAADAVKRSASKATADDNDDSSDSDDDSAHECVV